MSLPRFTPPPELLQSVLADYERGLVLDAWRRAEPFAPPPSLERRGGWFAVQRACAYCTRTR